MRPILVTDDDEAADTDIFDVSINTLALSNSLSMSACGKGAAPLIIHVTGSKTSGVTCG